MPKQLRILVTGGAGFIGSHLCDRLLAQGHMVTCFDNLETGFKANLVNAYQSSCFKFVLGDVRDGIPDEPFDQVYNLACPASPPQYQRDSIGTLKTSVMGAINVLDHAVKHGARVLQASTSEVYGDPDIHPQPEEYVGSVNCSGPRACYDEGKRAAETLFYDYHRQHGVQIRVARIFNTYGPRMSPEDGRCIPNFLAQALTDKPITVYGNGSQTRSFCYVDDLVDGLIRLMNGEGGRIGPINLGNPVEHTVLELAQIIKERTSSSAEIVTKDLPADDPKIRRPNIAKAEKQLDWLPSTPLLDGLDKTTEWFLAKLSGSTEPSLPVVNMNAMAANDLTPPENPFRRQMTNSTSASASVLPVEDGGENSVAVIGGGPAGLTAAYELQKRSQSDHKPIVFEATDDVGGISRTESYKGFRFDIGGHRFFTKVKEVEALWHEVGGEDFILRPRMSRIFYRGKYYAYPLKIFNALSNMGPVEAMQIMLSYFKWQVSPHREEENFEQWVTNRFGKRLFEHFFKSYTEKVWGIPCTEIRADWAAQRIKNLSLTKAVLNALTGANDTTSLIEEFEYPRLGPGQMWERFRDKVRDQGGEVRMQSAVTRVIRDDNRVEAIEVVDYSGGKQRKYQLRADHFVNSMAIKDLIHAFDPPPPPHVVRAADRLKYRDFLIVTLVLDHPDPFPDNWIYIHSPEVHVGRIQNFRSWSPEMVPDPNKASIGMEYFCHEGDGLWATSDDELIRQASRELEFLGLAKKETVVDGKVIRQPKAYPVYDGEYREALDTIQNWILGLENFQTVGRNGMHRYNNQDHSMLTAMLAARNILGEEHDIWNVNVERSYHEDFEVSEQTRAKEIKAERDKSRSSAAA
ncbi:MAG: FAD-dependent oxidoreductase [Parvularculaceae bacterium]|nr:FAD-dependent oxidoreductase [Parvularculaceae bacterium]